jgi:L-methionine (R)-S-oxide reductase
MTSALAETDEELLTELRALLGGEPDPIARAANAAALLYHRVPRLNWVGLYWRQGSELVLGPFQGQPACTRIPLGRGVCGTAAARQQTIVVDDVHEFPGHIVCDTASLSELVVPLIEDGACTGVLDIDSPERARFGPAERALFEAAALLIPPPRA